MSQTAETLFRPRTCQSLSGKSPLSDGDKCGAPVAEPGSAYCRDHAHQAIERRQTIAAEADDDG